MEKVERRHQEMGQGKPEKIEIGSIDDILSFLLFFFLVLALFALLTFNAIEKIKDYSANFNRNELAEVQKEMVFISELVEKMKQNPMQEVNWISQKQVQSTFLKHSGIQLSIQPVDGGKHISVVYTGLSQKHCFFMVLGIKDQPNLVRIEVNPGSDRPFTLLKDFDLFKKEDTSIDPAYVGCQYEKNNTVVLVWR